MSLVAICPAADLISANEALEAQGFGPSNFAVVSYSSGRASHAALHAWHDPAFTAAVTALPNVAYDLGEGDPITRTRALIEAHGAQWGADAPEYGGTLTAGTLYRYSDQSLWWCIQSYDTAVYSEHPSTYPALITQVREPGAQGSERLWEQIGAGQAPQPPEWPEWKPWDGNNASLYQIGDKVSHKGSKWISTSPNNHWEPGVYGWERQQ